jgi:hypothetical protein
MAKKNIGLSIKKLFEEDGSRKSIIYGGNFVAGVIGNQFKYNLGNPIGAIFYGGLDFARHAFPGVKENKYIRLTEVAGTLGYAGKTLSDLLGILYGNWDSLAQLPFDAGMLYEIGKNTAEDYKVSKSNIKKDIIGVKNDIVDGINYMGNLKKQKP